LRIVVESDGEVVETCTPDHGYLHRSIEKIGECVEWPLFVPYTDRVDYVCAMTANHAWAAAVEKLGDLKVPERGEYLRVISDELNRISSHCIALGAMAMDIGAITPFPYTLREREYINDLIEQLCGARLTYNYHRIGGVGWDMPKGWRDRALAFLDHFEPIIDEFDRLITYNEIFIKRLANLAPVSPEEAIGYGLVGPNLRASGVAFDLRWDEPYSVYSKILPKIGWQTPVGDGRMGTLGDSWDRWRVRVEEWRWSVKILREALDQVQQSPPEFWAQPKKLKPKGDAYARVEAARGDMGCYVVGDGGANAYRARFRTGSFTAMKVIHVKSRGLMVADLVALIASLDIVAPEIDR
jgi:NADH-quinone oxidoreductase subunit D